MQETQTAQPPDGAHRRSAGHAVARVAAGASELRDLIVEAWKASATHKVGYPGVTMQDVAGGKEREEARLTRADEQMIREAILLAAPPVPVAHRRSPRILTSRGEPSGARAR